MKPIILLAFLALAALGQEIRIATPAEERAMAAAEKDRQASLRASPVYLKLSADLPTRTANVDAARLLTKYVAQYNNIRCITIEYRHDVITNGKGFREIVHLGYDRDQKGLLHQSHSKFRGVPSSTTWNAWTNIAPKDFAHAMSFDGDPANYISNLSRRPIPFDSPAEFLAMPPPPPREESSAQ